MKTIILGDTHGTTFWKLISQLEKDADRFIFIGDYFDSLEIKGLDQINNFLDIIEYKKTSDKEIVLLIGNHDYHYFPEIGNTGTSGYQNLLAPSISYVINENRQYLQIAYKFDNILCTHAGVTKTFCNDVFGKGGWSIEKIDESLNELFKHKPKTFEYWAKNYYSDPSGDDVWQSPIWVRPRSLQRDGIDKKKLIQIVGHTKRIKIDIKGNSTGGRYYYIDTLETSGEYLIIENKKISSKSVR